MKRAFSVAAILCCSLMAGCTATPGSDDARTTRPQAAGRDQPIRLSPTRASRTASRLRVEPAVSPRFANPMSVVRVTFASTIRLGAGPGGRFRSYYIVARRRPAKSGCVQHRDGFVDRGRRGDQVTGRIDPSRGAGGEIGWCSGRYRGEVRYGDGFACPRTGRCREPRGFERIDSAVARFRFEVE